MILRKEEGEFQGSLPDGLDNLAQHNLLSYKSIAEPFDDWTLDELIGHYVNYRKQVSPSLNALLPKEQFQLYGVSTRFPQKLAGMVALEPVQEGVYQVVWGTHPIRLLVLSEMPPAEQNLIWNLFSTVQEKAVYGAVPFKTQSGNMSSIINDLFEYYRLEGLVMPYTMEDYQRDVARRYLSQLTVDEILQQVSVDKILQQLSVDEILQRLPTQERLRGLSVEEIRAYLEKLEDQLSVDEILQRLSTQERLRGLSVEEIRAYLEKLEDQQKQES